MIDRERGNTDEWTRRTDNGVGVLEEGDEDEPVVDPHVRDHPHSDHLLPSTHVGPVNHCDAEKRSTPISFHDRPDSPSSVLGRVKICSTNWFR